MQKIFNELSMPAFPFFPRLMAALVMLIARVLGKAPQEAFLKLGRKVEEEKTALKMRRNIQ